jgi:hypothetical protein
MTNGMRYLVQTRLSGEGEEDYTTVAAPEDAREAVAIAKFLCVPDPLDPDGEFLRVAIVVDEEREEEFFDGIRRAEYQLEQIDRVTAERLAGVGVRDAAQVSEDDMRASLMGTAGLRSVSGLPRRNRRAGTRARSARSARRRRSSAPTAPTGTLRRSSPGRVPIPLLSDAGRAAALHGGCGASGIVRAPYFRFDG